MAEPANQTSLTVDYLRRCMDGTATEKVFKISLLGAKNIRTEKNGFNLNIPTLCRYI